MKKKCLSLILVLSMIMQLVCIVPAMATETETMGNVRIIYENDFESDINGWAIGETKAKEGTYNLSHETYEGKGVLALSSTAKITNNICQQPTAFLDFDDIEFTQGNKIVIEMSLKQSGDNADGQAWSYLKYNRPNSSDLTIANAAGKDFHTGNVAEDADNWWTMLMFQSDVKETTSEEGVTTTSGLNRISYMYNNKQDTSLATMSEADTTADWTDLRIVIDEGTKYFSVDGKTGDQEFSVTDGWIDANDYEINNTNIAYGTALTDYDSLDNLTLYLRQYIQTLYVDSFKVYEISPTYTDAVIVGGSSVKYDEAVQIKFVNTASDADKTTIATIAAVPEGAVTITDEGGNSLAVTQEYDSANQTISVKPEDGFTKGEIYTIALNETVLNDSGIISTGTTSFTVRARDAYKTGVVLDDNFATGTDNWVVGQSVSGYEAAISPVDAEGAVDGKALKITFPDAGSGSKSDTGRYGSVTKLLGDIASFSAKDTLTVKARVKADTAMNYQIKANRPNTLVQPPNDFTWDFYNALLMHSTAGDLKVLGSSVYNSDVGGTVYNYRSNITIATSDDTGLWTEYTITFKPAEEKYYVTVVTTDAEGNETTIASNKVGYMLATKAELDSEFGIGYFNKDDGQYYLDLSSLTFTSRTAGDLYIDYVKAYTEKEITAHNVTAYLTDGSLLDKTDAVKVTFVSDDNIAEIPEGAVAITGVEAEESYDATTKTVTLNPTALEMGKTYTVTVDADALYNAGIEYTGEETLTFNVMGYGVNVLFHDTFDTQGDLGGWKLGVMTVSNNSTQTLAQDFLSDGTGVMKLTATATSRQSYYQPNAFRDFEDITFVDGSTIVIETRFKVAGGGTNLAGTTGSVANLMFNRPNDLTILNNWSTFNYLGWNCGILLNSNSNTLNYRNDNTITSLSSEMGAGEWVNAKLIIDGTAGNYGTYKVQVWKDGNESAAETQTGTLKEYRTQFYDVYNYNANGSTEATRHDSFDSLTWAFDNYSNELLVDYVKLSKVIEYEATATMNGGSSVKYDEPIKLTFKATDAEITSIPDGAVTISGVETSQSFDAETGVLSVTPANTLTTGNSYTVTVNTSVLETVGMEYTGTTSFTVRARDDYDTGVIINDNFASGVDSWFVGQSKSGYEATMEPVDAEGAVDGKALKITFPAAGSGSALNTGYYGSVTKLLGDGAKFSTEETLIVKARVKADTAMNYQIKANRADSLTQPKNDFTWTHYNALLMHTTEGKFNVLNNSLYENIGEAPYSYRGENTIATSDDTGLWTEYTITFKPAEEKYYVTIVTTDASGNETTIASNKVGYMLATKAELDSEFGIGYFNKDDGQYYLDLSSLTFTSRTAGNLYVDYVKVFEQADGRIINHSGASAMYNEPLKFTLESSKPIAEISDGAVVITGVEAIQTYDAETQTITLTPDKNLTIGETYKVTIDKDILANDSISYTGITSFLVRARDERETGKVISDDFNDGTTEGWTIGAANSGYEAGLDVVDVEGEEGNKALKVSMNAIKAGSGNQPNVTRVLGNGIEFKNGEWVTIEARVKKSSEGFAYKLKANRPDTITQVLHEYEWSAYGIMGNTKAGLTTTITSAYALEGVDGAYSEMPADPDAKTVGTDWVTYTIVFKPETGCFWITGIKDDGTYVTNPNGRVGAMNMAGTGHEAIFGVVPQNRMGIPVLENLTFVSHDGTTGDLYIDYINVSINNTNVIGKAVLTVNGEEIDEITAGTTVKPVFTINPEEGVTEYTVISALYIDGIMQDTHINPIDVTEVGTEYTEADGWVIPSALEGRYEIKAFVWNTLEGMKPVSTVTQAESAVND